MKKYRNIILTGIVIAAVLVGVLWWGGNSPGLHGFGYDSGDGGDTGQIQVSDVHDGYSAAGAVDNSQHAAGDDDSKENNEGNKTDKYDAAGNKAADDQKTDENTKNNVTSDQTAGGNRPQSGSAASASASEKELTCTLSVNCGTILDNLSWLNEGKTSIIPKNGVIFAQQTVTFYEGESVFNLLVREMKRNGIHLEFENTPIYNSAYIEGIGNIYEFDCGELSGWMYRVNGVYPDYGCSQYQLKPGDRVEWVYTCTGGEDIGGRNSAKKSYE